MTYLDWASTTPPDAAILEEALKTAASFYGNPSSRHGLGLEARARLEEARASLLASVFSTPAAKAQFLFTSGGSEADALILLSLLRRKDSRSSPPPHLVTTKIEHSAIYEEALLLESLGLPVSFVSPRADGRLDPEAVAAAIRKDTGLVAVMALNNETGAIQPLAAIAERVSAASRALGRREAPHFHSDAVQALGKMDFRPGSLGLSSAAFSAHKIRGPRGMGGLWLDGRLEPLIVGGGQEAGLRPGTENLQGAWAFSKAATKALASLEERRALAGRLEARLLAGLASIEGALPLPLGRRAGDINYSPFIVSIAFPGLSGEVLERALSDSCIAVSTGSACSSRSGKKGRRVLEAMGLKPELALSAIRVSTGENSTDAEIDLFLEKASALYRKLKV